MDGRDKKCVQNSDRKLKVKDNSEDLDIYGRIILEWILGKMGLECVECIHMA